MSAWGLRSECLRVAGELKKQIDTGKVQKLERGLYQIDPDLLRQLDPQADPEV